MFRCSQVCCVGCLTRHVYLSSGTEVQDREGARAMGNGPRGIGEMGDGLARYMSRQKLDEDVQWIRTGLY